jgi:hypothetical protein
MLPANNQGKIKIFVDLNYICALCRRRTALLRFPARAGRGNME